MKKITLYSLGSFVCSPSRVARRRAKCSSPSMVDRPPSTGRRSTPTPRSMPNRSPTHHPMQRASWMQPTHAAAWTSRVVRTTAARAGTTASAASAPTVPVESLSSRRGPEHRRQSMARASTGLRSRRRRRLRRREGRVAPDHDRDGTSRSRRGLRRRDERILERRVHGGGAPRKPGRQ